MANAVLGASEAPDSASFRLGPPPAYLHATEPTDTARFTTQPYKTIALAVVEPPDLATFRTRQLNRAHLAATEQLDEATFAIHQRNTAALVAKEAPDRATFRVGVANHVALGATDAPDVPRFHIGNVTAHFAVTERPDAASFRANRANGAWLRAHEPCDVAAFHIRNNHGYIAATEAPDHAAFRINSPVHAHFAVTEPADRAAFIYFTAKVVVAWASSEAPDNAAFTIGEPAEPPCEPRWTRPVDYYLNLITSEHNQRPNYMTTVADTILPIVTDTGTVAAIPCLYDIDVAVGAQLDVVGQWVGKSRWVEIPNVFFSWDTPGLGWDQANWQGPYDTENSLQRLDDWHYRLLLYAAIVANHWDGSVPEAYASWDVVFRGTGLQVVIQDWGDMTMAYGLLGQTQPDAVLLSLFLNGEMDLKPEGIELRYYMFQSLPGVPLFAFDGESTSIAGWDQGQWAILVPPGQGYIPGAQGGFA
jgi:hypothetical protein